MISLEKTKVASVEKDPCTDQIATLRIIVEQSIEWNSSTLWIAKKLSRA